MKTDPERAAWIAAHGSPRLKRLLAEGIEHGAVYRDERLAMERPGWAFYAASSWNMDLREPRNAPLEAFSLLDRARGAGVPATLNYYLKWEDDGRPAGRGYCCTASHLGRAIVFGERLELPMDRRAA